MADRAQQTSDGVDMGAAKKLIAAIFNDIKNGGKLSAT